jgi:DNA-binding HxlR family transcriptional regulator
LSEEPVIAITRKKASQCPIEATIAAISARWKSRILWQLAAAPHSFTALRQGVAGISDRMLTAQLGQLVDDGIVALRHGEAGNRYALTTLGVSLLPVLRVMQQWGEALIERRAGAVAGAASLAVQEATR